MIHRTSRVSFVFGNFFHHMGRAMTKTLLNGPHCFGGCLANSSGGYVQQCNKLSFRDYPGTIFWSSRGNIDKTIMSGSVFVCSRVIYLGYWLEPLDDQNWSIRCSSIFRARICVGESEWDKFVTTVVLINSWKWEANSFINLRPSESMWNCMKETIFIRFNKRGNGSNESPHSCLLVRVQEDHAHRENAWSGFAGVQQSLVRCHMKPLNKYTNVAITIPN